MVVSFYDALHSVAIHFVLMVLDKNTRVFRKHILLDGGATLER